MEQTKKERRTETTTETTKEDKESNVSKENERIEMNRKKRHK